MGTGSTSRGLKIYLPLALAAVVAAIYANSLNNPFLLRDHVAIVQQRDVTQADGWWRLWIHDDGTAAATGVSRYEPATVLTYRLNAAVSAAGLHPQSFRIVNVSLLVLLGILLARWLSYLVHPGAAWLAALLLVAHPALGQTINQISGRDELLAMTAVMGFALLQRQALQAGRWSKAPAVAAAIAAFMALGASITGLLIIPLALAQQWLGPIYRPAPPPGDRRRKPVPAPQPAPAIVVSKEQKKRLAQALVLILGLPLLLFLVLFFYALSSVPATSATELDLTTNPVISLGLFQRVPSALALAWFYTWQALWPAAAVPDVLHILPRLPQERLDALWLSRSFNQIPATLPMWLSSVTLLGAAVVLAASFGLVVAARRRPVVVLALTLALGQWLLASHLFWPRADYASNDLLPPFALAAVMLVAALIDRVAGFSIRRVAVAALPCILVIVVMGLVGHFANQRCASDQWVRRTDMFEMVEHGGAGHDNPVVRYNYAQALLKTAENPDTEQDLAALRQRAIDCLQQALAARPNSVQIHSTLARAYAQQGNLIAAEEHFKQVVALHPANPDACHWFDAHGIPPR